MMTAQSIRALRETATNLGARDFLTKPMLPEVLVGAVEKALANSNAA